MNRNGRTFAGLGILVVVALLVAGFQWFQREGGGDDGPAPITVSGPIGGEKAGFLANPEIAKILDERYGITVEAQSVGSLDMVQQPTEGRDFLWPSSEVALEYFRESQGSVSAETVFNSPIVIYTWAPIADALAAQGVVTQTDGVSSLDLPRLVRMIEDGTPWAALGIPAGQVPYGNMAVFTTDPGRSNSGNMFAGLLANTLNGGQVVDDAAVDALLPRVQGFFARLGYLEGSSGTLFDKFLTLGMGAEPMVVGYESQLVEYSLANERYRELIAQQVRVLYPTPTVYSSHPIIALTEGGERLMAALRDADLQRLAWERHGFRSGQIGVANDPEALRGVAVVPATIASVIPMPRPSVMFRITQALALRPEALALRPEAAA